jgi:DNA-binding PadR family transcriptional regulator
MRRKDGALVPFEKKILKVARFLNREFYGFEIAEAAEWHLSKSSGYGTLYRALNRLEKMGYMESHWVENNKENIPQRKYYKLTGKEIK